MREFFKRHWKILIILILIVLGFLIYYEAIPRYNSLVANVGYGKCLEDMADNKAVPLRIKQGNQTGIVPVGVCSQIFQQEYQNICEVQG